MSEQEHKEKKRRAASRQPDEALPPHLPAMERAALGCIVAAALDVAPGAPKARDLLLICRELGVREEWFYELRHQIIYRHLQHLADTLPETVALDLIILGQRLHDMGELEKVGGWECLNKLQDSVPGITSLHYYLDVVKEQWTLRTIQAAAANLSLRIQAGERAPDELLATAQQELAALAEDATRRAEQRLKFWLPAVIDNIEDYHRGHAQIRGLSTGIDNVDKMLCGLGGENGNMIVLAARPGIGKTSFALQLAAYAALECVWFEPELDATGARVRDELGNLKSVRRHKAPVAIFSLEMSARSLTDRLVWQRAKGDKNRWRTGFATDEDLIPLSRAAIELGGAEIYIDETPRMTVEELAAKARRMVRQYGIKLFVIDYLQLLRSARRDWSGDRVQELAYISGLIFSLGKTLNVPFVLLAQMNRDWEKENQRAPRLSDLKDCGAIEQDAHLVGFLYKPKLNQKMEDEFEALLDAAYGEDWSKRPVRVNLLWEKNRHGLTGDCWLLFHRSCTAFQDFNVWMKERGLKTPAAGEPKRERVSIPSNEELGI